MIYRWAAFVLLACALADASTDVVVLKSGTMMEGRVETFDEGELILLIESGKTILVRDDIASIHFDTTVAQVTSAQSDVAPASAQTGAKAPVAVGEWFTHNDVELRVSKVVIGKVPVRDVLDDLKESTNELMQVHFQVRNASDRKILRYSGSRMFGNHYVLRDDVDNVIRGVSFGFGNRVDGALKDGQEIDPGSQVNHVEIFRVPPPKTQHLDLALDLDAFGAEGKVDFRIGRTDLGWGPID